MLLPLRRKAVCWQLSGLQVRRVGSHTCDLWRAKIPSESVFFEHATRRVYLADCTDHPDSAWVSQQARQMTWELQERGVPMRYLTHDHDTKFTGLFDTVLKAEGIEIVNIPFEAPNANAIAERWGRSVREECLDCPYPKKLHR